MKQKVIIARAFCRKGQGGNLAGVVLESELTSAQMQDVAAQLGFSETVFIQKGSRHAAHYYTPNSPIDFCGHATLAAFKALGLPEGRYPLHTASGLCSVEITSSLIYLNQPLPIFGECIPPEEIEGVFGISPQGVAQIVSTGLKDIIVPMTCGINPDLCKIQALCEKYGTIGMHLFEMGPEINVRNFAPRYGIPEESATGSSNGALACYLYHHGILKKTDYLFRQGDGMNQPSDIHVQLETEAGQIKKVACGGEVRIKETRCITPANIS